MNILINNMEGEFQIDAIYTDFSKAFDRVHHGLLIQKLRSSGIPFYTMDIFLLVRKNSKR